MPMIPNKLIFFVLSKLPGEAGASHVTDIPLSGKKCAVSPAIKGEDLTKICIELNKQKLEFVGFAYIAEMRGEYWLDEYKGPWFSTCWGPAASFEYRNTPLLVIGNETGSKLYWFTVENYKRNKVQIVWPQNVSI